jgi:hypothetical protein
VAIAVIAAIAIAAIAIAAIALTGVSVLSVSDWHARKDRIKSPLPADRAL